MRIIRCPDCNAPLPAWAHYCNVCGETLEAPTQEVADGKDRHLLTSRARRSAMQRPAAFRVPYFLAIDSDKPVATLNGQNGDGSALVLTKELSPSPVTNDGAAASNGHTTHIEEQSEDLEKTIHDAWHSRTNWQKIVDSRPSAGERLHETPPGLIIPAPITPLPPTLAPRRRRSGLLFWVSMLVLFALVIGGLAGVVITLSRGIFTPPQPQHASPALNVTPADVALGALISLHGTHFTPNGRVGLSYDASIPLIDTNAQNIITADKNGNFSDTAIVEPEWQAGPHTIHAEDATLHKIASFTVMVSGTGASLRPAHLQLSTNLVDLGSGDQATNSMQAITLTNVGGGQIAWQATVTQPWLAVSPKNGTFANGQTAIVTIAGDRSNLKPGSYTASVVFSSNAGQVTLPVKMSVTALPPAPGAILQITPAVLSFNATDGGDNPPGQVLTISNPGEQALQWSVTSTTTDGTDWLSVSPGEGKVAADASQPVKINVNIDSLLPGVYNGLLTFKNPVMQNSSQIVDISLTVAPQCMLQVSPGALSFAGVYGQPAPAAKTVNLGPAQGCSGTLHWSAMTTTVSGGQWLSINGQGEAHGSTPDEPSVGVNTAGLAPGSYTGAVIFTTTMETQTLPVTLTIGRLSVPIMLTRPEALYFSATMDSASPGAQTFTITNTGRRTLFWTARAATSIGGSWLRITPENGVLASYQSTQVQVSAILLSSLVPDTYTGVITITGHDEAGNPAVGSPEQVPVVFRVAAACSVAVTPVALNFTSVTGQGSQEGQMAIISAGGACGHSLRWVTQVSTTDGGSWLSASPEGNVNPAEDSAIHIVVSPAGLSPNTYTGTVRVAATDRVTQQQVGPPQVITVTFNVEPTCTLQAPSVSTEVFNVEPGANPAPRVFTIGVAGACGDAVTIIPTVTQSPGTDWLAVTPVRARVIGGAVVFRVVVNSAALPASTYTGLISLAAVQDGITITGSPQTVGVTLNVQVPAALSVSPSGLTFSMVNGVAVETLTISNTGDAPLNWRITVPVEATRFVALSAYSGTGLEGGTSVSVKVIVNTTELQPGVTYTTSVTVSAADAISGEPVADSPVTIPVTITVAQPIAPPAMQVSTGSLSFETTAGQEVTPKTITITNTGSGTLTWEASKLPGARWLTIRPRFGSDAAGASSTITLIVSTVDLLPGVYSTWVRIIPLDGEPPMDVKVTLTVDSPPPTATATGSPSPAATATDLPTATSTSTATSSPTSTPKN